MEENILQNMDNESKAALSDMKRYSVEKSLIRFYKRHDVIVRQAIHSAAIKPACQSGCSYCCYYKVEVSALEIIVIKYFINKYYTSEQIQQMIEQTTQNVEETKNLTYEEHLATNQKCPFLVECKCAIYSVRPSKCRDFYATDVDGCKASYEQPNNFSIPYNYIEEIFGAANASSFGFKEATKKMGYDSRVYDLNSAILEAIQNPKTEKRHRSGKKAFINAKVVDCVDD